MRLAILTIGGLPADAAVADFIKRRAEMVAVVARSDATRARGGAMRQAARHWRRSGFSFLAFLTLSYALGPQWPRPGGGRARQSLRRVCQRHGVPLVACRDVNAGTFRDLLTEHRVNLILTACFDQILREPIIATPAHGAINIHPAPLPAFRGPCPLVDLATTGSERGAATIHRIEDSRIDAGAVLASCPLNFDQRSSILARERQSFAAGLNLLDALLDDLPKRLTTAAPQGIGEDRTFPDRSTLAELRRRGVALWRVSDLFGSISAPALS